MAATMAAATATTTAAEAALTDEKSPSPSPSPSPSTRTFGGARCPVAGIDIGSIDVVAAVSAAVYPVQVVVPPDGNDDDDDDGESTPSSSSSSSSWLPVADAPAVSRAVRAVPSIVRAEGTAADATHSVVAFGPEPTPFPVDIRMDTGTTTNTNNTIETATAAATAEEQAAVGELFVGEPAVAQLVAHPESALAAPLHLAGRRSVLGDVDVDVVAGAQEDGDEEDLTPAEKLLFNTDACTALEIAGRRRLGFRVRAAGATRAFADATVGALLLERVRRSVDHHIQGVLRAVDVKSAELQQTLDEHAAQKAKYLQEKEQSEQAAAAAATAATTTTDDAEEAAATAAAENGTDAVATTATTVADGGDAASAVPQPRVFSAAVDTACQSVLALPASFTAAQRDSAVLAARLAGYGVVGTISSSRAAALCYGWTKRAELSASGSHSTTAVLLVEVGHLHAAATLCTFHSQGMKVLAESARGAACGSAAFDHAIFETARVEFEQKNPGNDVLGNRRARARLLREARKTKEVLSGLSETVMAAECLMNDLDVRCAVSRSSVEGAPLSVAALAGIRAMVTECLDRGVAAWTGDGPLVLSRLEVVGGGARMPAVQRAISEAANCHASAQHGSDGAKLSPSFSLDSAHCFAVGAAIAARLAVVRERLVVPAVTTTPGSSGSGSNDDSAGNSGAAQEGDVESEWWDRFSIAGGGDSLTTLELVDAASDEASAGEEEMKRELSLLWQADAAISERKDTLNALEAFIFGTRSRATEQNEDTANYAENERVSQEQLDTVRAALTAAEDWMFDDDPETGGECAPTARLQQRLAELQALVDEAAPGLQIAQARKEAERQEFLRAAAEEQEKLAQDKSHESRALRDPRTNKQKLEAAASRKEQGNKLFREHDYDGALVRYTQGLEALLDTFDLTPEQEEECKATKLVCYLNAAQACLKVKKYPRCIHNCNDALKIDEKSVKALFRRAQAYYYTREFEKAKADCDAALALDPENRDVKRTLNGVNTAMRKQLEKEKAMFGKMFG